MKELVFSRTMLPAMERNADKVGFINAATGASTTFGEHVDRIKRLSGALADLGVTPKDHVAVLSMNSVPFMEIWHASLIGAAIMNPLNMRFSPEELGYVLTDSESKVLFVDATFAKVVPALAGKTKIEHVILIGDGEVEGPHHKYEELLAAATPTVPPEPEESAAAALMYTGGTTGMPKGVVLSQRAEVLNQYHYAMEVPWNREQSSMVATPMFHGASMLAICGGPMFGVTTVVVPAFDPTALPDMIQKYDVGFLVLVPTMIAMMLGAPGFDPAKLKDLKRLVYGGSPMPTAVQQKVLSTFPDLELIQGYGSTESCAIATTLGDAEHRSGDYRGAAGRPLMGLIFSIQDEDGNHLPTGQVGELCLQGGNLLTEYLNKPEETKKAIVDGWFHSGDVGYLDEKGYLYLVDRAKDMIISGGENVYSTEVENALSTHPSVAQSAVIGIPHDTWGEQVHAVVVLKPDTTATEEELIAHARTTIAGYKVPRSIEFRAEPLPMSAAMKVLKKDLRAPYWEGRDTTI